MFTTPAWPPAAPTTSRRALRDNQFRHLRTKGSHEVWEHSDGRNVSRAGAGKDNREVPSGTLKAIREQTGIKELR
ncbi:MAG: type II toxin-antitoxin system HicA family toxin [Solirubrobacteraceae bacterium]